MSEEQHQKLCKEQMGDALSAPSSTSSANSAPLSTTTGTRITTSVHDMRNQEFVTRLMAATPPYLYSAPMGPNNYFFSDMLRSLVAARNQKNARNLQLQQTAALTKRCKKRTWSQYRTYFKENDVLTEKSEICPTNPAKIATAVTNEKPLELTTYKPYISNSINKMSEIDLDSKEPKSSQLYTNGTATENNKGNASTNVIDDGAADNLIRDTPPAASLPPHDLVLPPPPPVWYPSLYTPYGIDPLHFFIDLRVPAHGCDRKKENKSPPLTSSERCTNSLTNDNSISAVNGRASPKPTALLFNKHGLGSAFSVPQPRSLDLKTVTNSATNNTESINLDLSKPSGTHALNKSIKFENYAKYYDFGETKENRQCASKGNANYMLQHLPRLYTQFATRDLIAQNNSSAHSNENPELQGKSDADCDIDSDEPNSVDNYTEKDDDCYMTSDNIGSNKKNNNQERDIDVEYIDTVKYHRNADNSGHCNNPVQKSIA